jgi:CheY-like chemotaxis protein
VLVVDDDEPLRNLVCLMLESGGCHTGVAGDGAEALDRLTGNGVQVDAVVMDLGMPNMTGIQCYQAMQKRRFNLPVVILSGTPKKETLRQHPDLTHLPYIEKPFNQKDLLKALCQALKG